MDLSPFDGCWLAIQVKSQCEQVAGAVLSVKGYEVLVPMVESRDRSVPTSVKVPLFPSYIFFRHNKFVSHLIVTTTGFLRVLGNGRTPIPLEETDIESVKAICRSGLPVGAQRFLHLRQPIEISDGPLRGARGTIIQFKKRSRLIVSVNLLQRSVFVEVDLANANPT
jgi:transcription antitermination factor NusG